MRHLSMRIASIFLIVFLGFSLFAEGAQAKPAAVTVTDALGREVSLPDTPSRIVLTGKAVIMLIDALYMFPRAGERVVAVGVTDQGLGDFFPVLDPDSDKKARLGKNAGPEEILAQKPDLVLLKSYLRDSLGKPLETAGVPVIYLDLETPAQYERDLRILGDVLAQPERAEEIIALFNDRVENLRQVVSCIAHPYMLLLNVGTQGGDRIFSVPPKGWIQGDQVELAGGIPVWYEEALSPGWNKVNFEQIARWNPQSLILLSYRGDAADVARELQTDPLWKDIQAVKDGRIFSMPADFYSWGQPDSRWILGAEWIATALRGGDFGGTFNQNVFSFFHDFYGMPREKVEQAILPLMPEPLF